MAFNLQTFRERALTAIVFVIIMLTGLLWTKLSFIILFTIIHFGCWYEFIRLIKKIKPLGFGYLLPLGLLYITLPILLMIYLGFPDISRYLNQKGYENNFQYSAFIPCLIVFSIWINDTMAYIVGSFIGKTPLSKISPKKTWEGTIGGALLAILVTSFLGKTLSFDSFLHPLAGLTVSLSSSMYFLIAAVCAFFGTGGDLLESKLKRLAGVKDSGTIMPGHGGFLDRFDSLLIATPFVWLCVYFMN